MDDNANVMPDDRYNAMLEDMKAAGPENGPYAIDPILCVRIKPVPKRADNEPDDIYKARVDAVAITVLTVINGNHRLQAAQELGWKRIRGIVDPSIKTALEARIVSHKKNYEHGDIEPWRQAELVADMAKEGKTQKEIAAELHISEDTVKRRNLLLKVDPEVKKALSVIPEFGTAHWEIVGGYKPHIQKMAVPQLLRDSNTMSYSPKSNPQYRPLHTSTLISWLDTAKSRQEQAEQLQNALSLYPDHKTCPKCHKKAVGISYQKIPWVTCEKGHTYNIKTGKSAHSYGYGDEDEGDGTFKEAAKHKKKAKKLPAYIRTTRTLSEYQALFSAIGVAALPSINYIARVRIDAFDKDGNVIGLDLDNDRDGSLYFTSTLSKPAKSKSYYSRGEEITKIHYSIQAEKYKAKSLKDFHTTLRTGPVTPEETTQIEGELAELFKKYGKKEKSGA